MAFSLERLPRTVDMVSDEGGVRFRYIDQRRLPGELAYEETADWRVVVEAIKTLAVRGAPAIGIAGAAAVVLGGPAELVAAARPTAVNLSWAVARASAALAAGEDGSSFVQAMIAQDEAANRAIGMHGAAVLPDHARVITHCNAGSLATAFYGTALGVIYAAAEQGKIERVFADETRPVNQGARLTVWELARAGVPVTLICDNMAASLMCGRRIDAVIVGADRIAVNGDTANKIGTYGLAIAAKRHGVPFYVAASSSTIDASLARGAAIPIEERTASEVLPDPIEGVEVWNPSFDVTPAELITAIITEHGVFEPGNQV